MQDIGGWIILALFFIPVFGGLLLQVVVSLITIVGPFAGMGTNSAGGDRVMKIRVRDYDMDEDY